MNKMGINLWNWITSLEEDYIPLVRHVSKLGFTAIELPMSVSLPDNQERLLREISCLGLEVSLCASMTDGRDISHEDKAVRSRTEVYLKECVDFAQFLGSKIFAGPLYAGGGKRHWLNHSARLTEWSRAVDGIAALGEYSAGKDVSIAVEAVNRYRTSVVNTTQQALQMVKDIALDNVGILFDTYQSCIEDESVIDALEATLYSGKLFHFHASANHRGPVGTGHLPWKMILKLLKEYNYQGHITMETFCTGGLDAGWVHWAENQDIIASAGLKYLKEHL